MNCFRAWEEWAIYPEQYLIHLQNIFLGFTKRDEEVIDKTKVRRIFIQTYIFFCEINEQISIFVPQEGPSALDGAPLDGTPLDGLPLDRADLDGCPIGWDPLDGEPVDDIDGVPLGASMDDIDGLPCQSVTHISF